FKRPRRRRSTRRTRPAPRAAPIGSHRLDGPGGFAEAEDDPGPGDEARTRPRPMRGTPMRRPVRWLLAVAIIAASTAYGPASAQDKGKDDIRELKLRDWEPRSMLVTKVTEVARPAFPAVDVHNHLGGGKAVLTPRRVQ